MCAIPQVTYGPGMTPPFRPLAPATDPAPTGVFCATCGHSQLVHTDQGQLRCLHTVCACFGFVVGAAPDISAQVFPA
jgi:hypothetical protein